MQPWHRLDGRRQEWPAIADFRRQRLVLRRHAAHRIANPAIDQRQPIVRPRLISALGKSVFDQRRVEQVAGKITGKRSSSTVGALQARREADNQQPPIWIAERGNRRVEPSGFAGARGLAKGGKPRTKRAIAVWLGVEGGGGSWRQAGRRIVVNRRNRRHRPSAPWWWRAAGIAERDAAARGVPDARKGRGRAWIAVPPDR